MHIVKRNKSALNYRTKTFPCSLVSLTEEQHLTMETNTAATTSKHDTFQMMIAENSSELDINPWNRLHDAIVEKILVKLPISDILFRCPFVCKRWSSIIRSPTFSLVRRQLSHQRPWFILFDIVSSVCIVYDIEVCDWRRPVAQRPLPFDIEGEPGHPFVSNAGLMCCFRSGTNSLFVCNPLIGSVRLLPELCMANVRGFAMHVSGSNYKVFTTYGRWPNLVIKVFSSVDQNDSWMDLPLRNIRNEYESWPMLQREMINTRCDLVQMKGVTITGNQGQVLIFYLILDGILVCFDTQDGTIFKYPRLLDRGHISADLVECGGRIFVVVLMEAVLDQPASSFATETRTLRIWEFDQTVGQWKHVSAMPTTMSREYDEEAHIICSGHGNDIMVCVNSIHDNFFNQVVTYDIKQNNWVELSPSFDDDNRLKIVWGYCFVPDPKAKV